MFARRGCRKARIVAYFKIEIIRSSATDAKTALRIPPLGDCLERVLERARFTDHEQSKSEAMKVRSRRKYTWEFKEQVVALVEQGKPAAPRPISWPIRPA